LAANGTRASFTGIQGHYMHRPGRVNIELELANGNVEGVWIIGHAVSIFETEMEL